MGQAKALGKSKTKLFQVTVFHMLTCDNMRRYAEDKPKVQRGTSPSISNLRSSEGRVNAHLLGAIGTLGFLGTGSKAKQQNEFGSWLGRLGG